MAPAAQAPDGGQQALAALDAALAAGNAPVIGYPAGIVYVNDSSMSNTDNQHVGQAAAIPLGAFMAGWQAAGYGLTVLAPKTVV